MSRRLLAMPVVLLLVACGPESKKKPALLVDEPVQQYEMGIGFLRQGRPDRALPYLEMASATEPQNPLYAYGVGLALLGMKDYRRAEAAFLQVLDIDPFLTDAHNNLGIIYGELGDKQRARAQFERVLTDRRYPTPEVARYNLGALLLDAGSYQQAADHLGAAAELKPDNAEWRLRYALALSGLERWSAAREQLQKALELRPDEVEALYQLGLVCRQLNDQAVARQSFERVRALAPGTALATEAGKQLESLGAS